MKSTRLNIKTLFMTIVMALLCTFAAAAKDFVVVIDPGHGGNDPGACGNNCVEKEITLSVGKKLAAKLKKAKGIKVVMTRNDDRWVWLTDRTSIANNNRADLYISLHCDSSKDYPSAAGSTIFYPANKLDLVRSNPVKEKGDTVSSRIEGVPTTDPSAPRHINDSKRFARLAMSSLTSTASRRDRGVNARELPVLQYSKMPAVLIELDFISNPEQETYLNSESGQDELATAISKAVIDFSSGKKASSSATPVRKVGSNSGQNLNQPPVTYTEKKPKAEQKKNTKETKASTQPKPKAETKPTKAKAETKPATAKAKPKTETKSNAANGQAVYKIQFYISDCELKPDSPKLKGLKPVEYYMDGKTYKYTYGSTTSREEANKLILEVKKLFGDAFIITFKDGKRVK